MPFEKGNKASPGRPKGKPNHATGKAREAIALFVEVNTPRLQAWLDAIAENPKQGPLIALQCVTNLLEYHVPKLARTELTGKDGGSIAAEVHHHYGVPPPEKPK